MKIRVLGTRGSLPITKPETKHYGGNTSCIEVIQDDQLLILDAGTGILRLSKEILARQTKFNILLTHLHIDHIQGLGFFKPLFNPENEVHIWGPSSSSKSLRDRLNRYLSPPLFPVHYRDIPCKIHLHEISHSSFNIGKFHIDSNYICHPGPTVGFRISNGHSVFTYLPDHEHILGVQGWDIDKKWISGIELAEKADLLIHDSQYTDKEYEDKIGWGHCTFENAVSFAERANVKKLLLFHHDPDHSDKRLEEIYKDLLNQHKMNGNELQVELAVEGKSFDLG